MIWKARDPLFSERAWWPSCVSMGPNAGPAGASIFLVSVVHELLQARLLIIWFIQSRDGPENQQKAVWNWMIDHSLVTGFTMFIRRSFDMTCFGISTYHRHEPPLGFRLQVGGGSGGGKRGVIFRRDVRRARIARACFERISVVFFPRRARSGF